MEIYSKNKTLSIAIMLIIYSIMLSSIAGVVQANTEPWWSDAFYTARTIDGFPSSAFVKGETISLDLENELADYQTIYTKRVAKIKDLNTGNVVKDYTFLSSKKPIEPRYCIINVDTGTTYTFDVEGFFNERMPGGSGEGRGYQWDQKDKDGNQVAKGKYMIKWYWSDKPSPAPKNKYTNSGKFKIT